MPVSKKRKKKGKSVGNGEPKNRQKHEARVREIGSMESAVSLQDLINAVAYQDKHGIVADDAVVHIPETLPVTVGEGEDKREVGTASPIPGDEGAVSINITDPDILEQIQSPGNYSIEETQDGRE